MPSQTIKSEDRLKALCICKSSKVLCTMHPFLGHSDKNLGNNLWENKTWDTKNYERCNNKASQIEYLG